MRMLSLFELSLAPREIFEAHNVGGGSSASIIAVSDVNPSVMDSNGHCNFIEAFIQKKLKNIVHS